MLRNIDAAEACKMIYALPAELRTAYAPLGSALGRVLAEDIRAVIPYPPFDRSPFDGFAFRGADTAGASRDNPAVLKITEEIPAGTQPRFNVASGFAAKILTGAPMPRGADSTVKYEDTEFTACEVRIFSPIPPGTDVVPKGSDVRDGELIASAGSLISPPVVAALANQGIAGAAVFEKPVVSVISTGSELCEVGEPLRPASIYNSNSHTVSAYLESAGASPVNCGCVRDDPSDIASAVGRALERSDMVITTGGASVGDYDWAVASAELLGADILFWKIAMKPGGAIAASVKHGKLILSLSGNPAAAVLGLLRIAMPYIKKLCGRADCFYPEITAALREALGKGSPKLRLLRGRLEITDSRAYFAEGGKQGSEAVSSLAGCDLLGEIPAGSPPLPAGTIIKAYRI